MMITPTPQHNDHHPNTLPTDSHDNAPPKKATKPGADVDNDGDNVNDNHDEWWQLIMITIMVITIMMNDRADHDGDNDDDLTMITTPDPSKRWW